MTRYCAAAYRSQAVRPGARSPGAGDGAGSGVDARGRLGSLRHTSLPAVAVRRRSWKPDVVRPGHRPRRTEYEVTQCVSPLDLGYPNAGLERCLAGSIRGSDGGPGPCPRRGRVVGAALLCVRVFWCGWLSWGRLCCCVVGRPPEGPFTWGSQRGGGEISRPLSPKALGSAQTVVNYGTCGLSRCPVRGTRRAAR